jgi:hypothetical protein
MKLEARAKKKHKKSTEKKKEFRKSRSRSPSPKRPSPARPSTSSMAKRDSTPELPENTVSYRPFKKFLNGVVFEIR